jgi:hypothetical protein
LIAERKELLPLSRAKAGVESTHPSENNTESLYIKTYFLTLFFSLLLNQNVGFWWAFSAVAAIEGIKKLTSGNWSPFQSKSLLMATLRLRIKDATVVWWMMPSNIHWTKQGPNYPYKVTDGTWNANKAAIHAAKIAGLC